MNLDPLIPGIERLQGDDVGPGDPVTPARSLTVLTGSGASVSAGAPSTTDLTSLVAKRAISSSILDALRHSNPDADFEDVLYVLEELDSIGNPSAHGRLAQGLSRFVELSPLARSATAGGGSFLEERFAFMEIVRQALASIDYGGWTGLYRVLRPLLDGFNLRYFTLNYDLMADVLAVVLANRSNKYWYNGFGTRPISMGGETEFHPDEFANPSFAKPAHITVGHLHGSIAYEYWIADERRVHSHPIEIVEAPSLERAAENWRWFHKAAISGDLSLAGVAPIVAGLRKAEKVNRQPFGNYLHAFAQSLSTNPALLLIGYGGKDEHVNFWLHQYTLIHSRHARVVEITREQNPARFAVSQLGHDLRWRQISADAWLNDMGIEALVCTIGVSDELPLDSIKRHLECAK